MPDSEQVKKMFGTIAYTYDRLNSLLSFNIDRGWRRTLVKGVLKTKARSILDVACGSGKVVFELLKAYEGAKKMLPSVIGTDFCEPLLDVARHQPEAEYFAANVAFEEGDALNLGYLEDSFDAVTVSFGLRNFSDRPRFYSEAYRVLKPGGRLHILEFSQPSWFVVPFYRLYQWLMPIIAGICGSDPKAYAYLNSSINSFPNAPTLATEIAAGGFTQVTYKRMTFGVVALHTAQKAAAE